MKLLAKHFGNNWRSDNRLNFFVRVLSAEGMEVDANPDDPEVPHDHENDNDETDCEPMAESTKFFV